MERLTSVVLSLGSNLGDRVDNLKQACLEIQKLGEISSTSAVYETPPKGFSAELNFLNICIQIDTPLKPQALLNGLLAIEHEMGRIRSDKGYTSRPIDIDIIFFGDQIIDQENLQIPHPNYTDRNFVLLPLNDLDNDWVDPRSGMTPEQLLERLSDNSTITIYKNEIPLHD